MTGFGRGEAPLGDGVVTAEVRTVNSRHLDVRARLPREINGLESLIREAASKYFGRGQVDVAVRVTGAASGESDVEIDERVAAIYIDAGRRLQASIGSEQGVSVDTLMTLPGVAKQRDMEWDTKAASASVLQAVAEACQAAVKMRDVEGTALERELRKRMEDLQRPLGEIEARAEEVKLALRERLQKRIGTLAPELDLDPRRLDQEIVLYVDRMDITEETVRLKSHLEQVQAALQLEGPVGRKLEFLLQEIGREINTIGSKGSDISISRAVVELKTEVEKIREQVLNIE